VTGKVSSSALNLFARISASGLVLVKISVDLWTSTSERIALSLAATSGATPKYSASSLSSGPGTGKSIVTEKPLGSGTFTTLQYLPGPTRNLATSSALPTVAERPISWNSLPVMRLSLSSASESWAPLLSVASSWTSSTITYLTLARWFLTTFPVSSDWSVSGVVIRSIGGLSVWALLSEGAVSPCLTATVTSSLCDHHSSLSRRSLFRALRGVM
jgi:hypothetical protein